MKAYYSEDGLRLCGKGWEIQRSLRALLTAQGARATLAGYLNKRTGTKAARDNRRAGKTKRRRLSQLR